MGALLQDTNFWVAAGLIVFVALVLWKRAPAMVGKMLDDRAAAIAKELEEARRLREEAQSLLAQYQRRQREAEREAEEIVAQARAEAERLAAETRAQLAQQIDRRSKMAERKIAQAEADALAEVKAAAAEAAVAAARGLIAERMTSERAARLADEAISGLRSGLS